MVQKVPVKLKNSLIEVQKPYINDKNAYSNDFLLSVKVLLV